MKNLNLKSLGALFLVFTLFTINIEAQERAKRQRRQNGPRFEQEQRQQREPREPRGPKIPNLTEEQQEQIKAFRLDHAKTTLPIRNQVNELEAKLKTLTSADELNKNEVGRVIDNLSDLKAELMKQRVAHMEDVKSVLTEEQKVVLNNQISRRPQRGRKPNR